MNTGIQNQPEILQPRICNCSNGSKAQRAAYILLCTMVCRWVEAAVNRYSIIVFIFLRPKLSEFHNSLSAVMSFSSVVLHLLKTVFSPWSALMEYNHVVCVCVCVCVWCVCLRAGGTDWGRKGEARGCEIVCMCARGCARVRVC